MTDTATIRSRLRPVHRAVSDLRRGTPVLLSGAAVMVVLSAETASADGLGELMELAEGAPLLVLATSRAAALVDLPPAMNDIVALALPPGGANAAYLRGLADPMAETSSPPPTIGPLPPDASAALSLAKLARLLPATLMAPLRKTCAEKARQTLLSVEAADILACPLLEPLSLTRVVEARVPLKGAPDARLMAFRAPDAGIEHLAIVIGDPAAVEAPLVRIHSECFTGDLLGSLRCDCGEQLRNAIERLGQEGAGVLLYLAQEGRGIGLVNKLRAYNLQDRTENRLDTLDANRSLGWGADERNFLVAATMLEAIGLRRVRLMTNNPAKLAALQAFGIEIAAREPHQVPPNGINDHYLATKADRFGHILD